MGDAFSWGGELVKLVWRRRSLLRRLSACRLPVCRWLARIVSYILSLKDQLDGGTELLVIRIAHNLPDPDILTQVPVTT
jgi:hypothetical protein